MPLKKKPFPAARVKDAVAKGIIISGENSVLIGSEAKPIACNDCKAKELVGNPVNASTGAKVQPGDTEFALPAPAPFVWQPFYASPPPSPACSAKAGAPPSNCTWTPTPNAPA